MTDTKLWMYDGSCPETMAKVYSMWLEEMSNYLGLNTTEMEWQLGNIALCLPYDAKLELDYEKERVKNKA